ncbi:hypothetical protein BaRGS_00022717 [Batillaria attramentaria]|uniref:Uncharacterized protein n=1 Tax=Batillaria attramentaria TaxID=370345 RepID=A0ABD0KGD6_9CAEN
MGKQNQIHPRLQFLSWLTSSPGLARYLESESPHNESQPCFHRSLSKRHWILERASRQNTMFYQSQDGHAVSRDEAETSRCLVYLMQAGVGYLCQLVNCETKGPVTLTENGAKTEEKAYDANL